MEASKGPAVSVDARAQAVMESCAVKAAISGVMGAGLGVFLGLLFGGYSSAVDRAVEHEGPWQQKLRMGFRAAGSAMGGYARNFALWGLLYSGTECGVEKFRARHDLYNAVAAGCATGASFGVQPRASIGARARVYQMGVGCAGMAAFSAAIDYWMEYRE